MTDRGEITRWCAGRLAKAKVARRITPLDEPPRTSVGEIPKFSLKEEAGA